MFMVSTGTMCMHQTTDNKPLYHSTKTQYRCEAAYKSWIKYCCWMANYYDIKKKKSYEKRGLFFKRRPEVLILTCPPWHLCPPSPQISVSHLSLWAAVRAAWPLSLLQSSADTPWLSSCRGPTQEPCLRLWAWPGLVSATPSPCWTYTRRWAWVGSTGPVLIIFP